MPPALSGNPWRLYHSLWFEPLIACVVKIVKITQCQTRILLESRVESGCSSSRFNLIYTLTYFRGHLILVEIISDSFFITSQRRKSYFCTMMLKSNPLNSFQDLFLSFKFQSLASHSRVRANLKKSKFFSISTTTASKYIPRICINWNPPPFRPHFIKFSKTVFY